MCLILCHVNNIYVVDTTNALLHIPYCCVLVVYALTTYAEIGIQAIYTPGTKHKYYVNCT